MSNYDDSYSRYLDGDRDALYDLVENYKSGLVLYLNSIVSDITSAEDLMIDTFTKLVIKKPKYLGKSSFKTWLYAIGRNLAIDYIKKQKRNVPLDEIENLVSDTESVFEQVIIDERKREVHRALSKLKAEHRQALILVFFEEFEIADAARIMKKSRHQFDSLLYRAKGALRRELEKGGFDYDEFA
ncbi:MAG: RNA polymerase sigma factor [Clostridia bacterium]|nr:RNA polymerase sigma factor [Clostridia bacterium]